MNDDQPTRKPEPSANHRISCTKCSYNLAGLDLTGSCPECGTKIITNCYQCDYKLEGLDPFGPCPECGFPINDSIGRGVLSRSEPAYLARLHRGVVMIQIAIVLMVLQAVGSVVFGVFGVARRGSFMTVTVVLSCISLLITLLFVVGWFRFSTPNPQRDALYAGSKSRRWIRVMLVLTALMSVLQLMNLLVSYKYLLFYFTPILSLIGMVIFAVRFYAEMLYIRWMAPLLRNNRAHERTMTLMVVGPTLIGLLIIAAIIGPQGDPVFGMAIGGIVAIGTLVMLIMYLSLLGWIRKDLKAILAAH